MSEEEEVLRVTRRAGLAARGAPDRETPSSNELGTKAQATVNRRGRGDVGVNRSEDRCEPYVHNQETSIKHMIQKGLCFILGPKGSSVNKVLRTVMPSH